MIEAALLDHGWNAQSLGGSVPVESLIKATQDLDPTLVWICYTCGFDAELIVQENQLVHGVLKDQQHLAVGGQALTADLRKRMSFDFFGDTVEHLLRFSERIHTPASTANPGISLSV